MLAKARVHRRGVTLTAALLDSPNSEFTAGIHRLADVLRTTGPNGASRVTTFMAAGAPGARSDVALNIALAMASNAKRVLVVDADLGRRELSNRVLGAHGDGLLDVVDKRVELDAALIGEPRTGLMILQAGYAPADLTDRPVSPGAVVEVLDRAQGYSIVVDTPGDRSDPLGAALAGAADAIVIVVTAEQTRARDLAEFLRNTDPFGGKLRGVVFVSKPNGIAQPPTLKACTPLPSPFRKKEPGILPGQREESGSGT